MNKLSQLAETLIGSEIVRLGNAIAERIRQGEKIYNYTIGDFDPKIFPIPLELKQAIQESFELLMHDVAAQFETRQEADVFRVQIVVPL